MGEKTVLYIVEQSRWSSTDVFGCLVHPEVGVLHSHVSSSPTWLRADLTQNFGRADELASRFGPWEATYVSLDDGLPDSIAHHFNTGTTR